MSDYSDFESPACVERIVTIGDKSKKYLISEMSAADAEDLFGVLAVGTEDQKAKAKVALRSKLIAACVTRADGSKITHAEARKFRTPLANELQDAIMEVNGLIADKNEGEGPNGLSGENVSGT